MDKKSIIGGARVGDLSKMHMDKDVVYKTNTNFWNTIGSEILGDIALPNYGAFVTEEKLKLLENNQLIFNNSYFDEAWYSVSLADKEIMLSNRKLSTYVNALSANGFIIEQMIEETDEDMIPDSSENAFANKARMLPVTFVIKARKL